jgi:two-component system response regulator CpxR
MLPGKSGFEILRTIRRDKSLPVLIVTGRSEDVDRIVGLEMGADDYVVKPFNMRELIARIRAVLRRSGTRQDEAARPSRVTMRGVEINPGDLSASRDGRPLNLTAVEFRLLDLLVRHAGTVVPREVLCGNALGRELHPYDRTVDMHISNVRRKLGPNGGELIKTVRSAGYLFCGGC